MNKIAVAVLSVIFLSSIVPMSACAEFQCHDHRYSRYDGTHDGMIDVCDVSSVADHFMTAFMVYDFDHDKTVDMADISIAIGCAGFPLRCHREI